MSAGEFFVSRVEKTHLPARTDPSSHEVLLNFQSGRNTRLHIKNTRPVNSTVLHAKWIPGQASHLPHRVNVTEDKNVSFLFPPPFRPDEVADLFSRDNLRGQTLGTQVLCDESPQLIDQILAVTWTFTLHQVTQQLNDLIRFAPDSFDQISLRHVASNETLSRQ